MNTLTDLTTLESARREISSLFNQHVEWFYLPGNGNSQALRREELEITISHGRLILSCWTEKGTRSWTVQAWEWSGDKLSIEASRRMGAERPRIELVPRASAKAIAATIKAARQFRCEQVAKLAAEQQAGMRVERVSLSPGMRRDQPGRYARILLRLKHKRIAVTGPVVWSDAGQVDALLSSALLWFRRTSERLRPPYIEQVWFIVPQTLRQALLFRLALLRPALRDICVLFEIDDALSELTLIPSLQRQDLFKRRLPRFPPRVEPKFSDAAQKIASVAPGTIDIVQSRHGETLRYHGLPFARVRSVMGVERVWFGLDSSRRQLLVSDTIKDWETLLDDLETHRTANAVDRYHALYRNAAEAWLESILRRDITKLDPGLIIAPLYAQFRFVHGGPVGARPIDLLALRRDGRLVVIELKVTEDRDHVFQGVDYWRRVEAHRRRGHISRANLFGERKISAEPPLVYLVAPTLRVHPALQYLARTIANDIEIYRFDINEDWRAGVRVMRRLRAN